MSQLQIPFLYAPFKETDEVDWIRPLKRHISQVYQQNPDDYKEETYTIHCLRQDIRGAGKDLTGRDLLYRYFGQLELLDLRFPIDEKHIRVLFTWYDAFNETSTSQYSLAFEKACIIFNIAATLSALAASQNRADADGRKRAYNFFQASAGMFQYINDNFLHAPSKDLHKDTIQLLINLMLVQAQECFLENSLREKKKDALIAKLASHTTWTYGNLIDQINEAISSRGLKLDPSWLVLCQVKQKYYQALAQVHRSQACYANHQYGEQVARLAWAEKLAKEGEKLATQLATLSKTSSSAATTTSILISYIGKTNQDATTTTGNDHTTTKNTENKEHAYGCFVEICHTLQASCLEKLTTAERDNDLIYHDQVPQESILVPIDRLKAVKAVPIHELYSSTDASKVIGPDIFQRLIPLSIHEASSLYSEEKAALIRRETERCDVAKAEYSAALDYMKLPQGLHKFKSVQKSDASITASILNTFASPPMQVNQWANEIKSNESVGSATTIQALIDQLQHASQETKTILDHISLQLDKEMGACESMRVKYGNDWLQDPSGVLTKNYRQDLRTHIGTLTNAQASDQQIIQKYQLISNELAILKQGADSQALETLFTDSLSFNEQISSSQHGENSMLDLHIDVGLGNKTLEQKINKIEAVLNKLDTLQKDREEILADLKDKTMKDDITQILVLNKKNTNAEQQIFTTQLGKYQSHQQRISTSIYQQQQTIQELGTAFKQLMELDEARKLQSQWDTAERQHHQVIKKLNTTFTDYQDIKASLKSGIEFYQHLADVVQSLEKNVDYFVNQRKTEREELADAIEQSRSHHEQELLKQQIGQYTTKQETVLPINTNTTTTNTTTTTTMNESNFIDTNQSLRDQLEQKMKELTFSHPPPTSSNAIPPPIQTNNINSNNGNNHLISPSNQMAPSFTPMMTPNHSLYQQQPQPQQQMQQMQQPQQQHVAIATHPLSSMTHYPLSHDVMNLPYNNNNNINNNNNSVGPSIHHSQQPPPPLPQQQQQQYPSEQHYHQRHPSTSSSTSGYQSISTYSASSFTNQPPPSLPPLQQQQYIASNIPYMTSPQSPIYHQPPLSSSSVMNIPPYPSTQQQQQQQPPMLPPKPEEVKRSMLASQSNQLYESTPSPTYGVASSSSTQYQPPPPPLPLLQQQQPAINYYQTYPSQQQQPSTYYTPATSQFNNNNNNNNDINNNINNNNNNIPNINQPSYYVHQPPINQQPSLMD
ncbi:unnamed protein product [Cunninghamella echinulata]